MSIKSELAREINLTKSEEDIIDQLCAVDGMQKLCDYAENMRTRVEEDAATIEDLKSQLAALEVKE